MNLMLKYDTASRYMSLYVVSNGRLMVSNGRIIIQRVDYMVGHSVSNIVPSVLYLITH